MVTRLEELKAKLHSYGIPAKASIEVKQKIAETILSDSDSSLTTDRFGKIIQYNEKQQQAVDLGGSGKSVVIIGAAGTGKTTCMKGVVTKRIESGKAGVLQNDGHKHFVSGTPGIVVCAYTRRATNNIRKNMPLDMQSNCITIHKLLEYQPVYYDVQDPVTNETKKTMKFEATRNRFHPLSDSIHTIIFEETSMLGTDLYKEVRDACPHKPQEIFLGDIQQLPPVFGPAILGFKMLELPVVELTEVYRQALESPIISLAHQILSGVPIPSERYPSLKVPDQLNIRAWTKKISPELALQTTAAMFCGNKHLEKDPAKHRDGMFHMGMYNPEQDMILLPFNKAFGTDELNKHIANFLAKHYDRTVYNVVAGFNELYFSPGDKVLYEKEDAIIVKIEDNLSYSGTPAKQASKTLDYWGSDTQKHSAKELSEEHVDFILSQVSLEKEDRVRQASHVITLKRMDSEEEIKVDKAAEINSMLLGYALTVHKSQGSEWDRVFFITHNSHATMLQRELIYTAVTRAKKELIIFCEQEALTKGILNQRVKGNTIAEKAEFFKGKVEDGYVLN